MEKDKRRAFQAKEAYINDGNGQKVICKGGCLTQERCQIRSGSGYADSVKVNVSQKFFS